MTNNFFKNLFRNFPKNALKLYQGKFLVWQFIAIALTALIVVTGWDWQYFSATRFIPQNAWIPAAIIGGLLPILLPLGLIIIGYAAKSVRLLTHGWLLGQSALLGYLLSIFYKALTGRIPPEVFTVESLTDISRGWQFGFLRGGVFWGWPSSHTTVAFAMAFALIAYHRNNRSVWLFSVTYALYIGLAVSVSVHWLSEFIAGAIFGTIVGLSVGKTFSQEKSS